MRDDISLPNLGRAELIYDRTFFHRSYRALELFFAQLLSNGPATLSLLTMSGPITLNSYTVATLPAATTAGQFIFVSDETGGAVPAFSDGTNWRRVTDRAIVS